MKVSSLQSIWEVSRVSFGEEEMTRAFMVESLSLSDAIMSSFNCGNEDDVVCLED